MHGKSGWFVCPVFSFCDVLWPSLQRFERDVVKFAVLLACKTTGPSCGDVVLFLVNGPSGFRHQLSPVNR